MVPYEFRSTGLTASHLRSRLGATTTKTGMLLPIVQANYNTDGSVCVRKVGHVTEIRPPPEAWGWWARAGNTLSPHKQSAGKHFWSNIT